MDGWLSSGLSISDELKSLYINKFEPSSVLITVNKNHRYDHLIPQEEKDNLIK